MKSMTGFGSREFRDRERLLQLTLKSYNNRFLELFISVPLHLSSLEQRFREFLGSRLQRGRVELYLKETVWAEEAEVRVDSRLAASYHAALRKLAEELGIHDPVRLSHLLRLEGVLKTDRREDVERYWAQVEPLLQGAYDDLEAARRREGEATRRDVEGLLEEMGRELAVVEAHAGLIEERVKENLRRRFDEVLAGEVDESRVLAETAVLLVKFDINEELVRLRAHLDNFSHIMAQGGAIGKKLDFLCQELNREVNTIGSKSMILEVGQAVVSLKDALEKIREQLRNVE